MARDRGGHVNIIRQKTAGIRWELDADFAPRLERVLVSPGRVIKQSPVKRVAIHELDGVRYFVKCYQNHAVPLRPLKFFLKRSHSRQEWELARRVVPLGIPLVRHVALGERWTFTGLQESLLITEGYPGVPLNEFAGSAGDDLQAVLGRFLRQMHDCGLWQRDLQHNILVRAPPLALCRVDLYGAEIRSTLRLTDRLDNLALLNVTVPLRPPFFAAYDDARLAELFPRRAEEIRRRRYWERSWRCLRTNQEFRRLRAGGLRWHVRLPFLNEHLQRVLDGPDRFLASEANILRPGITATTGAAHGLVLKRFNFRKPLNLLKDLFRPSRARRAYRQAYHLELLGLPTPRPIAVAQRIPLRSYLVVEEVPGAVHLGQIQPDRQVIHRLAELIARLHNEGFSHRDLKETNILVDDRRRPWLIDLDGVKFLDVVPGQRAARDLARLARAAAKLRGVTRADREAFLRVYCRARGQRPRQLFNAGPRPDGPR